MDSDKRELVSLVIPVYNEEGNLGLFYESLVKATKALLYDFELLFVDDCSNDMSPGILDGFRRKDSRVDIIRFSRNCGSHAAASAGLLHCRGSSAIIIAADLQDPADIVIPNMLGKWTEGYKVVWGTRKEHVGILDRFFYFIKRLIASSGKMPSGVGTILLDRLVIDAFNKSSEKNTSVSMLIEWMGFSQGIIEYEGRVRHSGKSRWTFMKKLKLSIDSLISFSYAPMRFMSLLGIICTTLGILYCVNIVFSKIVSNAAVEGWASLMIVVLLIGGVQMIMLGVLGEYLWRTYDEARGRPKYIIEKNTLLEKKV